MDILTAGLRFVHLHSAVADRYVDDAPAEAADLDPVSPADRRWWAAASADADLDRHFDERAALSLVMDRHESGLTDLDMLPAGIG